MAELDNHPDARGWECASHEVVTAPGHAIFVAGFWDGKRQTLHIDPDEVDEVARRLHAAKRYSRDLSCRVCGASPTGRCDPPDGIRANAPTAASPSDDLSF